jgi:hypothetical protein
MQHKSATFDKRTPLSGSYNWAHSAAAYHEDYILVMHDPRIAVRFQK